MRLPLGILAALSLAGVGMAACSSESQHPQERPRRAGFPFEAYCTAAVTGVGRVDVERDYLPHVVHCENGGAPFESLKAQAVAARTFLYYKLETAGFIGDGQSDQVYSCGSEPTASQVQAVKDTSGQFLAYDGAVICAFYVAGSQQAPPACQGNTGAATERYVTYNWGLSGDGIRQSSLGLVNPLNKRNRGCLSQWGSRCLAEDAWGYGDILKSYYGADIRLETAVGPCVVPTNHPPVGNVDGVSCENLRGWAQDPDEPIKALAVIVTFDPVSANPMAFMVQANAERQDLCGPLGSCNHAFEVALPVGIRDGALHQVKFEAVDTGGAGSTQLTGSPGTFSCGPPAPELPPGQAVRRLVPEPAVFQAWGFSMLHDVAHYTDAEVMEYPKGPNLPAVPKLAKADDGAGEVWLLDTGTRRLVPGNAVLAAWGFDSRGATPGSAPHLLAMPQSPAVRRYPFLMKGDSANLWLLDSPLAAAVETAAQDAGGPEPAADSGIATDASAAMPVRGSTANTAQGCMCGATGQAVTGSEWAWLVVAAWIGRRRRMRLQ